MYHDILWKTHSWPLWNSPCFLSQLECSQHCLLAWSHTRKGELLLPSEQAEGKPGVLCTSGAKCWTNRSCAIYREGNWNPAKVQLGGTSSEHFQGTDQRPCFILWTQSDCSHLSLLMSYSPSWTAQKWAFQCYFKADRKVGSSTRGFGICSTEVAGNEQDRQWEWKRV